MRKYGISAVLVLAVSCLLAGLSSCGAEKNTAEYPQLLSGDWSLLRAERDGVETETLFGLFMRFEGDMVQSNVQGETMEYDYELAGSSLHFSGEGHLDFEIRNLNLDTLVLDTKISDASFTLWFTK